MGDRLLESIVGGEEAHTEQTAVPENIIDEYIDSIVANKSERRNELFQSTIKMLEGEQQEIPSAGPPTEPARRK